ncbi:MAG: hemerythrin domain-containing protein [Acidobacteriia bacterium]|nr:hemerythrin domain-containing protein [Terriglobia bacterium]
MLRDKNLVPLSRQHQHALALCVRIDRASPIPESDLAAWQAEIAQHFRAEVRIHFAAEEQFVFPAARAFPELNLLVEELLSEHEWLRERFAKAGAQGLSGGEIAEFAQGRTAHIRKEERQLFERLQELISEGELAVMGQELERVLREAEQACILPAKRPKST